MEPNAGATGFPCGRLIQAARTGPSARLKKLPKLPADLPTPQYLTSKEDLQV